MKDLPVLCFILFIAWFGVYSFIEETYTKARPGEYIYSTDGHLTICLKGLPIKTDNCLQIK